MKLTLPLLALLLAGSANAQHGIGINLSAETRAIYAEQTRKVEAEIEQNRRDRLPCGRYNAPCYTQNNMGPHPDTRPDRDHSGTLSFEAHQRKLMLCMVDLTTITDPELRKWCEAQSRRLP